MNRPILIAILLCIAWTGIAQVNPGYWQQRIYCQMEVDMDHVRHQYQGTQRLVYQNQSPDTLRELFYHLYPNAFQKGSEMDAWSNRLPDPDSRIVDNLLNLQPEDEGFLHVRSLTMNGLPASFQENRTILEVILPEPIPPGRSAVLDMAFIGQVPIQTRRSGRDNAEGVDYSMCQWYPKICNYDRKGWHANPYVQREFYGVWGDYDVTIHIDTSFILGGSGYLQNPQEVGCGYEDPTRPLVNPTGSRKSWHFLAPNVHDFMWAADRDYTHIRRTMQNGVEAHFLYIRTEENAAAWEALPTYMDSAFLYIDQVFGPYPYRQYSFIQGGDGGMEYAMGTLITGNRGLRSLVGVSVHELMHSWYQMILGTNESLFAWMDEGFTSYASSIVKNHLFPGNSPLFAHQGSYQGYFGLVRSGLEEPLTTHADHFLSNFSYGNSAYSKGAVFLHQLSYIIGQEALDRTLLDYYHKWQFKHPTVEDFIRIAEHQSDQELDWYQEYWVNTTRSIDYGVDTAFLSGDGLHILLRQVGHMPMPVDLAIQQDGQVLRITIPLDIQRGQKTMDKYFTTDRIADDWPWTYDRYELVLPGQWENGEILISIDPTQRMADVNRDNNLYTIQITP